MSFVFAECDLVLRNDLWGVNVRIHDPPYEILAPSYAIDRAEFFTLDEILAIEQIGAINVEVAKQALSAGHRILCPQTIEQVGRGTYTLFLG